MENTVTRCPDDMRVSNLGNPTNEMNKLTTSFSDLGLHLAAARAQELEAKNSRTQQVTSYSSDPAAQADARLAEKCDSILSRLQAGKKLSKARELRNWAEANKAKKGLGSAKNFAEYAEHAQFPEIQGAGDEPSLQQSFRPPPYQHMSPYAPLKPGLDEKGIPPAVRESTIQRLKKEKAEKNLPSTLTEMLGGVDWEQEKLRYDVYGDVDMDFDGGGEEAAERKYQKAGQRTMEVRQISSLLGSVALGGADGMGSELKSKKRWSSRHAPY